MVQVSGQRRFDGVEERLEGNVQFVLFDINVPFQQSQQFSFGHVDLVVGKESVGVFCPVFVQRRRVVEGFGTQDQRCQKNPVPGGFHAYGIGRKQISHFGQINTGGHKRGGLYVGVLDETADKVAERHRLDRRGHQQIVGGNVGKFARLWFHLDDRISGGHQVIDHFR